ncbi:MAG: hypothetical protein IPI66_06420 [Chitinophagaceae bacterium]|nr:hypothetical protein [Chitinophagaceae bacterium]
MKKLIIALDGEHFPHGAFEFAKQLNQLSPLMLAGVFLSPVDYSKILAFSGIDGVTLLPEWLMQNDDESLVNKNIVHFRESCEKEGINYRVHKDNNLMALSSLVEETRFADLLLISSELFYKNVSGRQPNFYLEEVLKKTECPVMLVPETFTDPKQLVLAYDGSESCLFAIKQFAYLFPELTDKETILLSISTHHDEDIPEYSMVSELISGHFPNLQMQQFTLQPKTGFSAWMADQPDSYIVMGAFSRSVISEIFRKSFASRVIQENKMPVFISHK